MLQIDVRDIDGSTRHLALSGSLDQAAVEAGQASFRSAVAGVDVDVVVDMTAVPFVAAAGLQMIIAATWSLASRERRLVLFGCRPDVADLIEIVVPGSVLSVFEGQEEAMSFLARSSAATPAACIPEVRADMPVPATIAAAPAGLAPSVDSEPAQRAVA